MKQVEDISHNAIVTDCSGGQAKLSLMSEEECHQCHLQSLCKMENDPSLTVPEDDLKVGDMVRIDIRPSQAFMASFLAYLLPSILMIGVLIVGTLLQVSDIWLALIALGVLGPYYLIIASTRSRVKSLVNFQVHKL